MRDPKRWTETPNGRNYYYLSKFRILTEDPSVSLVTKVNAIGKLRLQFLQRNLDFKMEKETHSNSRNPKRKSQFSLSDSDGILIKAQSLMD